VDSGVTRLQAYYDNGANGMRAEIISNKNEMDQKWAAMQSTADILNRQLYDMKNVGSGTSGHGQRHWSILQDKAVYGLTKMSKDKSTWKNWLRKIKNTLGDIMHNDHWDFRIAIAEKNRKQPEHIENDADTEDAQRKQAGTYIKISKMMKTLLTEKMEEDTEGFLIIKRSEDGLRGYGEISRHLMELTGEGMNDK
jgi:hypothetical protein